MTADPEAAEILSLRRERAELIADAETCDWTKLPAIDDRLNEIDARLTALGAPIHISEYEA